MSESSIGYAIVTGAGSGIGRAIAMRLAELGWRIAVVERDAEAAQQVARAVDGVAFAMDVTDIDAWRRLLGELQAGWPRLDLLVNNAGTLVAGELVECDLDDLRRLVEVNLLAVVTACHELTPWLITSAGERPSPLGGHPRSGVINTASIFAALSPPGFGVYSATKAGVVALSESLRGELAPHGLNVTILAPGVVKTGLFDRARYASAESRQMVQAYLAERSLDPAEVAQATLSAAARGRLYAVIGRRAQRYWALKRWLPALTIRRVADKAQAQFAQARRSCRDASPPFDQPQEASHASSEVGD